MQKDFPTERKSHALGKPRVKSYFNNIDLLAANISIASFVVASCVISPRLSLSWSLGFEYQLVVVGFLLSVMNLCMGRVLPNFFLILEFRWDTSCLQNYDAILRNSLTLPQTSDIWRVILFIVFALPLGLSAAYKRFTSGHTTVHITSQIPGYYGLASPAMSNNEILKSSIYLMINASTPFIAASSDETAAPAPGSFPIAYGFNTLLLSNNSAAMLDIPTADYVASIQSNLMESESRTLSAQVNAIVTRSDAGFEHQLVNSTLWDDIFESNYSYNGLSSFNSFQGDYDLGLLLGGECGNPYCVLGFFNGSHDTVHNWVYGDFFTNVFMNSSPSKYDIQRERCTGSWKITQKSVELISGFCGNTLTSQHLWCNSNSQPFYLDAMPVLVHSIDAYAPSGLRSSSAWKMPAITIAVATMYWARLVYLNPDPSLYFINDTEAYYQATNETITSTVGTLDDQWLLYLVLCLQPVITIIALATSTFCYHSPISKGFGLISLLAGVERETLGLVKGAALSGELQEPVIVEMTIQGNEKDSRCASLRYKLQPQSHELVKDQTMLKRGTVYD